MSPEEATKRIPSAEGSVYTARSHLSRWQDSHVHIYTDRECGSLTRRWAETGSE